MKTFIKQKKITTVTFLLVVVLAILNSCTTDLVYPDPDIQLPPVPLNRIGWEVVDYSSQEDQDGEGEGNGRVWNTLDGNVDTFWHTCWNECTSEPPIFFTVDMLTLQEINGFNIIQRQSLSRNVEICEIEISDDNATWVSLGEFTLEKVKSAQEVTLDETVTARYFKFKVIKLFSGTQHAALAEIAPFF